MMDRFKEMIDAGIASRKYETFLPSTPEQDNIVRTYNNCFGLFTDTHMSKICEGEYVITGSLCRTPDKFDSFLYSVNYGLGTAFKVNGKVTTLSTFLGQNGLFGHYDCMNGDKVYKISSKPNQMCLEPTCSYGVCAVDAQTEYPAQLGEKLMEILSGIVESSKYLSEVETQLNESEQINGTDWTVFETSKGFAAYSNTVGKAILFNTCK